MTRGGWTARRPEEVVNSVAGSGRDLVIGRSEAGAAGVAGTAGGGGIVGAAGAAGATGLVRPKVGTAWDGGLGGKRGVVFALAGAPVKGGAEGFGGASGVTLEVCLAMLGIGLVTAVDQAGGTFVAGAGSNWPELCIGSVVAAETFGRGVGVIFAEAGLSGRGGRLMRKVSRLGAFGSEPSGVAESAIFVLFIVISENVQWRNSQS